MPKRRPKEPLALASLSVAERADVLDALLRAHPLLAAEAEQLAPELLAAGGLEEVAEQVTVSLLALHLGDLAARAGRQWGGGYVSEHEAAYELLDEVVRPYLADLERRAGVGAYAAATRIGVGLLLGLYECRACDDDNLVLAHAGLPDTIDDLASAVLDIMRKNAVDVSEDRLAAECPEWTWLLGRS